MGRFKHRGPFNSHDGKSCADGLRVAWKKNKKQKIKRIGNKKIKNKKIKK